MRLTMRIKPHEVKDGLLAYSAQMDDGGDFASLTIKNRRIEFRYDSGSGKSYVTYYDRKHLWKLQIKIRYPSFKEKISDSMVLLPT